MVYACLLVHTRHCLVFCLAVPSFLVRWKKVIGQNSQEQVAWSEKLQEAFYSAQKSLSSHQAFVLSRPSDQLWIMTDGSIRQHRVGVILYVTRGNTPKIAGFYSAKLQSLQVTWLPRETEALGIATTINHFSPFIIQYECVSCVLTNSKPCVQAIQKLYWGEFCITIQHLTGSANVPSDFASRNAPTCEEPHCQICSFIHCTEESVVHKASVADIVGG